VTNPHPIDFSYEIRIPFWLAPSIPTGEIISEVTYDVPIGM